MDDQEHGTIYYPEEFSIRQYLKNFKHSARADEIRKRSMLDKEDGEIIETHDQFYRDHKLLLTLFRYLAVMPVQRKNGRIVFSWASSACIYAYIFYALTTVIVVFVGYERLLILTTKSKKFDEYIYSIIFLVYLVPHFWIPYVGWGVAKDVCVYKNSWGYFQLDFYKITGKSLEFPHLSTLIVIISSGCLILAVAFLMALSGLLEGFTLYHTTAYYHIIIMINMNCALWYINCRAIGDASKSVADSFDADIKDYCSPHMVAHYRMLWLQLSEILQKLGNAYARTYSANSLFIITNITVALYGFTSEIVDHGFKFTFKEIGLLVDAGYCMSLFYVFCDCSHSASLNIATRVQSTLMNIDLSITDKESIAEIELFLVAIHMNPPKVSLQGYTVVNRELITASVATVAIYLIVLLQFKISLVKV